MTYRELTWIVGVAAAACLPGCTLLGGRAECGNGGKVCTSPRDQLLYQNAAPPLDRTAAHVKAKPPEGPVLPALEPPPERADRPAPGRTVSDQPDAGVVLAAPTHAAEEASPYNQSNTLELPIAPKAPAPDRNNSYYPAIDNGPEAPAPELLRRTQFVEPRGPRDEPAAPVAPPPPAVGAAPALPRPAATAAPAAAKKTEPLVLALEKFLQDRPDEAMEHLKGYDPRNQEFFLCVLPVLKEVSSRDFAQLDQGRVGTLHKQLESAILALRSQADLTIDRMCFCEGVENYGVYRPLPDGHVFRAGTARQPGELVQVYVQLANLCPEPRTCGYETKLSSSVEIRDRDNNRIWYYNFGDSKRPLQSPTLRRDHFNNYSFYAPHIPPGSYVLTIEIRDLTRPDSPRVAQQSLPFEVGT